MAVHNSVACCKVTIADLEVVADRSFVNVATVQVAVAAVVVDTAKVV